jgi:small subunit ribosomal protein S5
MAVSKLWPKPQDKQDWSFNMAEQRRDNRRDPRHMTEEEKQFDERVVYVNRVARVVKGGRRFRFQALVVIGDHKGKVGIGVSKGADVSAAVNKASDVAKKNMIKIALYKGTLTHEVEAKVGGSNILIMPASPGTGLIAGGVVRIVLEVAGIENALSKSLGSSNRINTAYATLKALQSMVPSNKWINKPEKPAIKKTAKTEKVAA